MKANKLINSAYVFNFQALLYIDRLSKMVYFLPVHTLIIARDLAKVLIRYVWKLHGSLEDIISD